MLRHHGATTERDVGLGFLLLQRLALIYRIIKMCNQLEYGDVSRNIISVFPGRGNILTDFLGGGGGKIWRKK